MSNSLWSIQCDFSNVSVSTHGVSETTSTIETSLEHSTFRNSKLIYFSLKNVSGKTEQLRIVSAENYSDFIKRKGLSAL